jgi:hypothetical protein
MAGRMDNARKVSRDGTWRSLGHKVRGLEIRVWSHEISIFPSLS